MESKRWWLGKKKKKKLKTPRGPKFSPLLCYFRAWGLSKVLFTPFQPMFNFLKIIIDLSPPSVLFSIAVDFFYPQIHPVPRRCRVGAAGSSRAASLPVSPPGHTCRRDINHPTGGGHRWLQPLLHQYLLTKDTECFEFAGNNLDFCLVLLDV